MSSWRNVWASRIRSWTPKARTLFLGRPVCQEQDGVWFPRSDFRALIPELASRCPSRNEFAYHERGGRRKVPLGDNVVPMVWVRDSLAQSFRSHQKCWDNKYSQEGTRVHAAFTAFLYSPSKTIVFVYCFDCVLRNLKWNPLFRKKCPVEDDKSDCGALATCCYVR